MRWLHLSDIEGRYQELRAAIPHIARVVQDEPIDLIVVTGELVKADLYGLETFRNVRDALAELRDGMNGTNPKPKMLVVPGEEDRAPAQASVAARAFERWFEDAALRESFSHDPDLVKLAEEGYRPFWQVFSDLMPDVISGRMPGDCSFTMSNGMRVGIVGLNSEFLAPAKRRTKKLRTVEPWQIEAAIQRKTEDYCATHDAILVAFHASLHALDAHSIAALSKLVGERGIVLTGPNGGAEGFVDRDRIRSFPGLRFIEGVGLGKLQQVDGKLARTVRLAKFQWAKPVVTGRVEIQFERRYHDNVPDSTPRPSTQLRKISLRHFRGIEALDVPLSRNQPSPLGGVWTCIAGINGVGKSSILQAIALAGMDQLDIGPIHVETRKRFRRWSGLNVSEHPTFEVPDLFGKGTGDALVPLTGKRKRLSDSSSSPDATIELEWATHGEQRRRTLTIQSDGGIVISGDKLDTLPMIVGYGASRNLSDVIDDKYKDASPRFRRTATLFYPLTQVARAEVLLYKNRDPRLRSIVSQIASQAFDKEFLIEMRDEELIFGGNEGIDALDLPDGFRSTLAWITDLAAAWCEEDASRSDDISAIEAIVLLDEIDLHLHPSLQRDLVPRLRRALPRVQWVVTTHAPLVLGSFHETELVPLDSSAPGGIRQVDRPILGFTVDQIMRWLMGVSPVGGEVERQIQNGAHAPLEDEKLAVLLEVSPDVSPEQAKAKIAHRKELLAKLRKGEL